MAKNKQEQNPNKPEESVEVNLIHFAGKTKDGLVLKIKVVPNSSKTQIVGVFGDRVKIKIASPPVDGKANEELLRFLKKHLNLKSSDLEILRGQTSPLKDVLIKK